MSVHAKGIIRFTTEQELIALLKRLTLYYENNNTESATIYDNLPESYKKPLLGAIAGFEVEITEIDHIFKLSQERDEKSYQNIIDQLDQQGSDGKYIAEEMRKRKHQLFSK
jgi:transcriptional regulator